MQKILPFFFLFFLSTQLIAQFPESFEGGTFPPDGWIVFDNGTGENQSWHTVNDAFVGDLAAFIRYETVDNGEAEDWLVTPQFIPSADKFIFSFFQKKTYEQEYYTEYELRVSTSSQDNADDFVIINTHYEDDLNLIYAAHEVDLSTYIGQAIYIAFVMVNDNGDNWFVDNVDLTSCAAPSDLYVANINGLGGELSWTDEIASSWDIEIVPLGGQLTGIPTIEDVTSTSVNWSGGEPFSNYDFYVYSDCGSAGISNPAGPYSFTTGCADGSCAYQLVLADTYGDDWNDAYIEIRQGGISIGTVTQTEQGFGPYYFDFPLCSNIDFELVWHSGSWDQECIFSLYDPWEQLYYSFEAGESPADESIFFSYSTNCEPVTCRFPSNLRATDITTNNAKLSWTETDDASTWDIEITPYDTEPTGVATISGVTANPYLWTEAEPGTNYTFRVRAVCGVDDVSTWSIQPFVFKTRCDIIISDFPLSENFETTDFLLPDCWTSSYKGEGDKPWLVQPDTYLDENVAICEHDRADQDVWLVSPEFDFSTMLNSPILTFDWKTSYYWMTYPYNKGDLNLRISTNGGNNWSNPIWSEDMVEEYTSFVWEYAEVNLGDYLGETSVLIAFQYTGNDAATVYLDHFKLESPPALVGTASTVKNDEGIQKIYPVPAHDFVMIEYYSSNANPISMLISDVTGKDLSSSTLNGFSGTRTIHVDLTGLNSGIYFVRIEKEGKTEVQRIVKL